MIYESKLPTTPSRILQTMYSRVLYELYELVLSLFNPIIYKIKQSNTNNDRSKTRL